MRQLIHKTPIIPLLRGIKRRLGLYDKYHHQSLDGSFCVSDNFIWRLDNGFETAIRITDLAKTFNRLSADLLFVFYDNFGHELVRHVVKPDGATVDMRVSDILDKFNCESRYGYFNAFFVPCHDCSETVQLVNRCYTGFGYDDHFFSFVHGNQLAKLMNLSDTTASEITVNMLYRPKRTVYQVQRDYSEFDRVEIALVNPFQQNINVVINDLSINLKGLHSRILTVTPDIDGKIQLTTSVKRIRPIAFAYKGNFFDVHHC